MEVTAGPENLRLEGTWFHRRGWSRGGAVFGYSTRAASLSDVERCLDRLVELRHFLGIARPHEPLQAIARNRDDVIEVRNALHGKALPSAENDLGRQPSLGSSYQGYDDRADRTEDGIPGEDHHRPASGG